MQTIGTLTALGASGPLVALPPVTRGALGISLTVYQAVKYHFLVTQVIESQNTMVNYVFTQLASSTMGEPINYVAYAAAFAEAFSRCFEQCGRCTLLQSRLKESVKMRLSHSPSLQLSKWHQGISEKKIQPFERAMAVRLAYVAIAVQEVVQSIWRLVAATAYLVFSFIQCIELLTVSRPDWEKADQRGRIFLNIQSTARRLKENKEEILEKLDQHCGIIESLLKTIRVNITIKDVRAKLNGSIDTCGRADLVITASSKSVSSTPDALRKAVWGGWQMLSDLQAVNLPFSPRVEERKVVLRDYVLCFVHMQ